jgi:hypothetical protein
VIINNAASRCNVGFWTNHLEDTEENDRAELKQIRGLGAANLEDALLEMQREAAGRPRLKNFLYHADFNPPPDKRFTEKEWERSFEIFEKERGIPAGTPRVVVEHEKQGRVHRHVIWSRLNPENMRAFADGLDAKVAHAAARKIELELGLEKVIGPFDREAGMPRPPRGPKPWEMYRGMKTGIDPRDVTAEVTELFRQSDGGKAFQAALKQHGYELATGNRGLLILDSAGKEHSLARRIEGVKTKELNAFMRDVDRQTLPTLDQAKAQYQERKIAGLEADRATVAQQIEWEEALAKAAIAKEQKERQFVEPQEREREQTGAGGREKEASVDPPQPGGIRPSPEFQFQGAAREATRPEPGPAMPDNLKGAGAHIWTAWQQSDNAKAFAAALDEQNISLASVTKDEAARSHINASFAHAMGNFSPRYREGDIVAVVEPGLAYGPDGKLPTPRIYQLNERTTGETPANIEKFMKPLDRSKLPGIDATRETLTARAEQRISEVSAFRENLRDTRNAERLHKSQQIGGRDGRDAPVITKESFFRPAAALARGGGRVAGGLANVTEKILGGLFSIFDPPTTPAQRAQAADKAVDDREIQAERAQEQRNREADQAARERRRENERER